jgi:squalene-hopene/tetraprenyl-beta-curcumene cyclase
MYSIMALDVLGHSPEYPNRAELQRHLDLLVTETEDDVHCRPCVRPACDTALAAFAIGQSSPARREELVTTGDWLLSQELQGWSLNIHDTAMIVLALQHTRASDGAASQACLKAAANRLLAVQGRDGGWTLFHAAMFDPSFPGITGLVMEALIGCGVSAEHVAIHRAVDYLMQTQEPDGSWYGRQGVNYIYGTFSALRGLRAAGMSDREAGVLRAGEWLRSIQNADGGWGESCESYERGSYVPADSTASQTAWAILGLLAGGDETSLSLYTGVEYLLRTQRADGTWDEHAATATGFPRLLYWTDSLYRVSFPALALSSFRHVKRKVT